LPDNKLYFSSSLRERSLDKFHHRCHLKNQSDFSVLANSDYKNRKYIVDIELEHIWINKDMYGLVWMIIAINEDE
jgi:hypothetical protein